MSDLSQLNQRIDTEFASATRKLSELQAQNLQTYKERQERLRKLETILADLQDVWRPRLETLSQRFQDRVSVTPKVTANTREATFEFQSELARISLRFSVVTDEDVRHVIFQYDLKILPILMEYDAHQELRLPLEQVNREALGDWIDERIISFVKTYLAVHENNYYLKEHLVQDPIAKIRFPKFAAGAKLERSGETLYFLGEETRRQFEEQEKLAT